MIRRVLAASVLAIAVAVMPLGAGAHEGHGHATKPKKVKKTTAKKTTVEFRLARPAA